MAPMVHEIANGGRHWSPLAPMASSNGDMVLRIAI
jgi:hypothetical protein